MSVGLIGLAYTPAPVPVVSPASFTRTDPITNSEAIGTVTASHSPTSFSIVSGNSAGYFVISNSGAITVESSGATPPDGSYSLGVTATNGAGTSFAATISVTIQAAGTAGAYPGQTGNLVGYNHTPSSAPAEFTSANGQTWPGAYSALTAWPGGTGNIAITDGSHATSGAGTAANPWVFAFYDFNSGTGGVSVDIAHCIFVGCRFQSNDQSYYNVLSNNSNQSYIYCSFTPLASLYTSPPGFTVWPSSGAQQNTTTQNNGVNGIDGNDGFQTGLSVPANCTNITAAYCDCWGSGNSFCQMSTPNAGPLVFSNCWIHDCANQTAQSYHQDGIGYVDGGEAPSNITIKNCTIASLGNTNGIAFQSASSGYTNVSITGCYFTGFGYFGDFGHDISANSNWTVTDNVFATDIQWIYGPIGSGATTFTNHNSNLWRRNTFKVIAGTTPASGSFAWTSADDGKFLLPGSTLSTTDWAN